MPGGRSGGAFVFHHSSRTTAEYYCALLLDRVLMRMTAGYWRLQSSALLLDDVQSTTSHITGHCSLRTTADPAHYNWVLQNCGTTDYCALLLVTGDSAEYYCDLLWNCGLLRIVTAELRTFLTSLCE